MTTLQHLINTNQWDRISRSDEVYSERFLRKHQHRLNWTLICQNQHLEIPFIREMKNRVDWKVVCGEQDLDEAFIREMKDYIDWDTVCEKQVLSESFMNRMEKFINWEIISRCQSLSEAFIVQHFDRLNIKIMCETQTLSEELIERILNKNIDVDWRYLFEKIFTEYVRNEMERQFENNWEAAFKSLLKENVVESFLRGEDFLDWNAISRHQKLNEHFMRKYQNALNWEYIIQYQNPRPGFIQELFP